MRTIPFVRPTCLSIQPPDLSTGRVGVQVNKLQQVSSLGLQVSLAGVRSSSEEVWTGPQSWPPDVTSRDRWGPGQGGPCTKGEGQGVTVQRRIYCMVRSNASWVMVTWYPPSLQQNDRQTIVKILHFHNFIGGWEQIPENFFPILLKTLVNVLFFSTGEEDRKFLRKFVSGVKWSCESKKKPCICHGYGLGPRIVISVKLAITYFSKNFLLKILKNVT